MDPMTRVRGFSAITTIQASNVPKPPSRHAQAVESQSGLRWLHISGQIGLDADGRLQGHHRLAAVRAHLLELSGDYQGAIEHYQTAASRTTSLPERNYLITQAARLRESPL